MALLLAILVFAISYALLSGVELLIHRLTKNSDKSYRAGVLIFSLLAAIYTFVTSLGR